MGPIGDHGGVNAGFGRRLMGCERHWPGRGGTVTSVALDCRSSSCLWCSALPLSTFCWLRAVSYPFFYSLTPESILYLYFHVSSGYIWILTVLMCTCTLITAPVYISIPMVPVYHLHQNETYELWYTSWT